MLGILMLGEGKMVLQGVSRGGAEAVGAEKCAVEADGAQAEKSADS